MLSPLFVPVPSLMIVPSVQESVAPDPVHVVAPCNVIALLMTTAADPGRIVVQVTDPAQTSTVAPVDALLIAF
jgi:hypothetical protein